MGGVTSSMAAKFAFFPPNPPSYTVVQGGGSRLRMTGVVERENVDVLKVKTKRGTEIVTVFVKNPTALMTVLYSHGNAADLGQLYELFCELSVHLRVNLLGENGFVAGRAARKAKSKKFDKHAKACAENHHVFVPFAFDTFGSLAPEAIQFLTRIQRVIHGNCSASGGRVCFVFGMLGFTIQKGMAAQLVARLPSVLMYDYTGYGQSSGKPTEHNTYADIEAAYRCLVETYGVNEEDVILYGQSVGSGPTIDLASRLSRLRAVVLHSPILSGLRVLYPVKRTYWFDIYKNIDKIAFVRCPVLVIHGTADDVVDCSHGKQLWELCVDKYEPLWVKGGNHCDLELYPVYIRHLKKFISAVEKSTRLQNSTGSITHNVDKHRMSTDCRDHPRASIERPDHSRQSTDCRDKPTSSVDQGEKSKKSVENVGKSTTVVDQPEKARNSIDRFGGMVRTVVLCNINCFKPNGAAEVGKS